jgi:hypothetical protein
MKTIGESHIDLNDKTSSLQGIYQAKKGIIIQRIRRIV